LEDWLPPLKSTVSFLRQTDGRSKGSGVSSSMAAVALGRCTSQLVGTPNLLRESRSSRYSRRKMLSPDEFSGLNVPLRTDQGNFGVLEADHTATRNFSVDDIAFLAGIGNSMARAVELRRALHAMEITLGEKQLFIREMNHRIKNNLSLVSAILTLQARQLPEVAKDALERAVSRINNLALVHDRLQMFTSSVTKVDAATHFEELCIMLRSLLPHGISLTSRCSGSILGDCVESLTLIANELITNAAKYAFIDRDESEVFLGYREEGAGWRLWVHDNGIGLLRDAELPGKSFGRQLIATLASRVNAAIIYQRNDGTRVDIVSGIA
jgi:two-component sensor histidine kinase